MDWYFDSWGDLFREVKNCSIALIDKTNEHFPNPPSGVGRTPVRHVKLDVPPPDKQSVRISATQTGDQPYGLGIVQDDDIRLSPIVFLD